MASATRYLRDLPRLAVNARKSAVDVLRNRKFLGFAVTRKDARIARPMPVDDLIAWLQLRQRSTQAVS